MIGGLLKSNRFAILAGSALLAGGLAVSPAQAADFGGDCCADLEERVAVLEATTARKGNRKVSLTISGWVNTGLLVWDDGFDSDAYVVSDNGTTLGSRITFAGNAKINSDWSAGYDVTIEVFDEDVLLGPLNQTTDDVDNNVGLLYSNMWVKSEQLGKVTVGLQSHPTDNISIVDLSGTLFASLPIVFEGITWGLRDQTNGNITNATWSSVLDCAGIGMDCNGIPQNVIRYDTPTIAGFTLSASWGENDFWDVALKYAGEFGDIKVAAAVGYGELDGADAGAANKTETLEGGASIMHTPTGIFVSGSFSFYEDNAAVSASDAEAYFIKAGIKQRWNSLGATAIYGEYAEYNDNTLNQNAAMTIAAGLVGADVDVERYGIGVHQWIDAAAMQVYVKWDHLEINSSNNVLDGNELDMFMFGGVIFF